jgi:hypothetical protein
MSKSIIILFIVILSLSCESILINPKLGFIVLNKSDTNTAWVKVFIQDTKLQDSRQTNAGSLVQIATFTKVEVNEQSSIMYVDPKQFSQTGNGDIYVLVQRQGKSDTLRNGVGSYFNFRDSQEFAPTRWRTREIIVNNANDNKGEVFVNLAFYKDGKYIESYGR